MKKTLILVLGLLVSFTVPSMAQESKDASQDKVYYVKKDGKLYRVKKVKKKPVPVAQTMTSKVKKMSSANPAADNKFVLSAGLVIESAGSSNDSSSSSSSNSNNDNGNFYGFDIEGGYQLMLNERVSLTPGLFIRRVSYSDALSDLEKIGVDVSARTLDIGANMNLGYDFIMDNNAVIRPMLILGYSRGNASVEASNGLMSVEGDFDYSRIQYGFGLQGIMDNGLSLFGKFLLSDISANSSFDTKVTNKSTGASYIDSSVSASSLNAGEGDKEKTLILGLGYWF